MKLIYSPRCLDYEEPGHPESPTRVKITYDYLKEKGYEFEAPKTCTMPDLLLVHTKKMIEEVKKSEFIDADTPNLPGIFEFACLSAGSGLTALDHALKGENAFSLMRPPGHHAGKNFFGGFCYFNNIAIAVTKALKHVKKVAIIDIDGHHGNGTQDIVLGKKGVLYVSLHQIGVFPMTGFTSEANCLNYPLSAGAGDTEYINALDLAISRIKDFSADIIAISAGFDTYKDDPLLGLELDIETYQKIGSLIASLKKPSFAILEGGYSNTMPDCVYSFLKGLEE